MSFRNGEQYKEIFDILESEKGTEILVHSEENCPALKKADSTTSKMASSCLKAITKKKTNE